MNDFIEKYNNYTNAQLIKIIEMSTEYQLLAVETAKEILKNRNLTDEDILVAKNEIEIQNQEKEQNNRKKENIENKVKDIGNSVIKTVIPIQIKKPSAVKTILTVSILMSILTIIEYYQHFDFLKFMFFSSDSQWDYSMIFYFLPLVILSIATLLFWLKNKTGWILLAIYSTYLSLRFLLKLIFELYNYFTNNSPPKMIFINVWLLILYGGILFVICQQNIRKVFRIEKTIMYVSIGISFVLTVITLIVIFKR